MLSDSVRVFTWECVAGSVRVDMMKSPVRRALDWRGKWQAHRRILRNRLLYGAEFAQGRGPRFRFTFHIIVLFFILHCAVEEDHYWFVTPPPPPIWAKIFKNKDLLAKYGGI